MASRTIQECDLYKTEYDPEGTVTVTFKIKGKRKGQSYDLSPEAAEALQKAMVSRTAHHIVAASKPRGKPATPNGQSRALGDVFDEDGLPDDDEFVSQKMAQRKLHGDPDTPPPTTPETETEVASERITVGGGTTEDGGKCRHINKTPPRQRVVGGKNGFWHVCKDCQTLIKPVASKSRATYHGATAPKGVNIGTHSSEDRRRD